MSVGGWRRATGAASLCALVGLAIARSTLLHWGQRPHPRGCPVSLWRRCTPSDEAIRSAREWRLRATMLAHEEREALEAWDPSLAAPLARGAITSEAWRLATLARDRGGYLRRARAAAESALALARTPGEEYRAAEDLAAIDHEDGFHRQELQLARRLVAIEPRSGGARLTLRRALRCSGAGAEASRQGATGAWSASR